MEGLGSSTTPDLETVLKTLAGLAPAQNTHRQDASPLPPQSHQVVGKSLSGNAEGVAPAELNTAPKISGQFRRHEAKGNRAVSISNSEHNKRPMSSSVIDPATIIDWPQGLRCVSKIASQTPNFKETIQKMMSDQDKHEILW